MTETQTTAEQLAHHEAEARRLKAELDAERGLENGMDCWRAHPDGRVEEAQYYAGLPTIDFPYTDDGKRKAERAALMMASLNFEDPPFEVGQMCWGVEADGSLRSGYEWEDLPNDYDVYHQGRIHATEAEALAWRDKFNDAWTQGAP